MNRRRFLAVALWAVLLAALQAGPAVSAGDDWIATWTASPHEVWAPDFLAPAKVPTSGGTPTKEKLFEPGSECAALPLGKSA